MTLQLRQLNCTPARGSLWWGMSLAGALVISLVLTPQAGATLLRVPGFYPDIQSALDVASGNDTVLVASGTYVENLTWGASQDGVTLLSEEGPDSTTIDGGLADPVIRCSNVGAGTRIEGFTIANGRATSIIFGNSLGGGIYLENADVTVTGCVIRDNIAFTAGGGIYTREGSPVISGNTFQNNSASSGLGGGVYCGDGDFPLIEYNDFIDNSASSGGGGLATSRCPAQIRENTFDGNQAITFGSGGGIIVSASTGVEILNNRFENNSGSGGGGAIYITRSNPLIQENEMVGNTAGLGGGGAIFCNESSTPEIRENLIILNTASAAGGGIAVADTSNPQLIGNTLAGNSAALDGGGIYITLQSNPILTGNIVVGSATGNGIVVGTESGFGSFTCNDVWNNLPANYSGVPDPTGNDGNISADPEFCNPGSEDYHLNATSPCAAANSPSGCGLIGALGAGCGVVAIDPSALQGGISLFQNVPNPVRDATRIRFQLSRPERVRLAIYNPAGRLVRLAHQGDELPAGIHEWSWDGRDGNGVRVSSGMYFYSLQAQDQVVSKKLIVLD
jgi:parallel beta-helix repeat protein